MTWSVMLPREICLALRAVKTARRHGRGRSRSAELRRRKREEKIQAFMRAGFYLGRDWIKARRPAFGLRMPVERITIK